MYGYIIIIIIIIILWIFRLFVRPCARPELELTHIINWDHNLFGGEYHFTEFT